MFAAIFDGHANHTELHSDSTSCPRAAHAPVVRARLIARLRAALSGRITAVVAPAGYGKTALLSQWLDTPRMRERRVAVISLQERDDDLPRLARRLLEALDRFGTDPQLLRDLEAMVRKDMRDPTREASDAFRCGLREALDDVPQRSVLVLEDAHVLRRDNVRALLDLLADVLPPPVHLLLTSRTTTPLRRSAALRVRGELTEIGVAELAFTPDEARAYLAGQVGHLAPRQTELLVERCEGWIAGLHLAGRALAGRQDPEAFLRAFGGRSRDVADFLLHEVLDHRSPEMREFLLDSAVLDVLAADICQAVTGRGDSGAMLCALEAEGGFLLALDDGETYRFHTLFAEFLRGELARVEPDRAKRAHLRAAHWLADADRPIEGFDHAIAARDFDCAAALLTRIVSAVGSHHLDDDLSTLFAQLPRHVIEQHPALSVRMAHFALCTDQPAEALLWCEHTDRLPDNDDAAAEASCLRSYAYWTLGDLNRTITWGERATALLDRRESASRHRDTYPRLVMMEALAEAYDCTDRFDAASEVLRDGLERAREGVYPHAVVSFPAKKAALLSHLGETEQVREYAELALSAAEQVGLTDRPPTLDAHIALGEMLCERNDVVAAEERFRTAARIGTLPDRVAMRARGMIGLSRSLFYQGRVSEAFGVLRDAMGIDMRGALPEFVRLQVVEQQVRLRLVDGDLSGAHGWLSEVHRLVGDASVYRCLRAWFDFADGADPAAVRDSVDALLHNGVRRPTPSLVRLRMLLARACHRGGAADAADAHVRAALELAAPRMMVRTLIEVGGADTARFLQDAAQAGTRLPTAYTDAVLRALDHDAALHADAAPARGEPNPGALSEPLTGAELDLIPFLATELTYAEIAARRFVSVNTVKSQLQAVYRKLGVTSRVTAIERSRALGLQTPHEYQPVGSMSGRGRRG